VDFAKKQAVVTVETAKYDQKALVRALEDGGFGGKVVTPAASQAKPPNVDKTTKVAEAKMDPDRQIVVRVRGLT
jgi:hypothetical protein